MTKVTLLNIKGEKIEDIKLNEEVFGITPNKNVLYDAIILARASLRQGTHDTKNRSEVSGGGRKPWRQKGTGHARQGSIRAVQWRGGGVPFGPTPRDYSKKQNRKERRLALKSAVVSKLEDFVVVDELKVTTPKTKEMQNILTGLKLDTVNTLVIVKELDENLILASRNIPNILLLEASEINVLDLVAATKVLVTRDALKAIEEVLK
ncbi:MAG: 50S ribosomal protein L4 [Bacilli bacterium]|nr:50S ribosomal protein L4 [Bacilli bacterium]